MGGPHGPLLGKVGGPMGPERPYGARPLWGPMGPHDREAENFFRGRAANIFFREETQP